MRIAVCKQGSRLWDKYAWVAEGFESAGHVVRVAGEYDTCMEAERWADFTVWQPALLSTFEPPRQEGTFRVAWMFDLLAMEPRVPLAEQPSLGTLDTDNTYSPTPMLRCFRQCDLVLVKERSMLAEYRALGVPATWFDQGCPAWMGRAAHIDRPPWDVLFLGNLSWRERRADAMALAKSGLRVAWAASAGKDGVPHGIAPVEFHPPRTLPSLVSGAAVVVDVGLRSDLDGFVSDKLWLLLGMGACHVRRWSPGLPAPPAGPPYLTYRDHEEMFDVIRPLLYWRDQRAWLGADARRWVMRSHTYSHQARGLVTLCKQRIESAGVAVAAR